MGSALGELNRLSERLSFPDAVRDEAVCIHKNASERGLARRRSVPIVASSIYAACREKGVPASLDEVAAASGLNKSDIAKCYRLLVTELDLRIPVADPAECVARVASRAKVNSKVEADALGILGRARRAGITAGMYPPGLAASALYLASLLNGQYLTQTEVAEAAGVAEITVRKEYRRIEKVLRVRTRRAPRKESIGWSELKAVRSAPTRVPVRTPVS